MLFAANDEIRERLRECFTQSCDITVHCSEVLQKLQSKSFIRVVCSGPLTFWCNLKDQLDRNCASLEVKYNDPKSCIYKTFVDVKMKSQSGATVYTVKNGPNGPFIWRKTKQRMMDSKETDKWLE